MDLVSFLRILVAVFLYTLTSAFGVFALPEKPGHENRSILAQAAPAAPHWVVYGEVSTEPTDSLPDPSLIVGFNVFALGTIHDTGASLYAQEWAAIGAARRTAIKSQYAAAGITLVVSAYGFGAASGEDPVHTANTWAAWVKQYDLDGIDVFYFDTDAFDDSTGAAEDWLISLTRQLRAQLPAGQFIITHTALAPLFSPEHWPGGGYRRIDRTVGSLIDWYNVRFHGLGTDDYSTCAGLLNASSAAWPQTALFEIAAAGVPLSKLVVGESVLATSNVDGFMDAETLAHCLSEAKDQGWGGGVATFEFPYADAEWIAAVRADSWPV